MTAQEAINKAFQLLSRISVRGDDVDFMAAARSALKEAYAIVEALVKSEAEESDKG